MGSFFESVISFFELILSLINSIVDSVVMMFQVLGVGSMFTSNITLLAPTILGSAVLIVFAVGSLKLLLSVF